MSSNNKNSNLYPSGSIWRKWDLHYHTPSSYDYENNSVTNQDIVKALKNENIEAVAITDHHIIDVDRINELKKIAGNKITIFPGIEFCSDCKGKEPIHVIGIFPENCDIEYIWDEIKSKTGIAKKRYKEGKKENEIYCNLNNICESIKEFGGLISVHAGRKSNSIEKISNALPVNMAVKEDIAKSVDIFELGQERDQEDYIDKVFPEIGKRPMIICSDNHDAKKYNLKEICWIKGSPTFEGLKQILYEPEPGNRVSISPTIPDKKNDYQCIKKIKFNSKNFPKEIVFNKNLCSIIGSRSSGKSALLNYIAHSINIEKTEKLVPGGAGEGEAYHWNKIDTEHSIEWYDGSEDNNYPGEFVYIPQNDLFYKSKDSEEIKRRIEPVLFKRFPSFKIKYKQAKDKIEYSNKIISEQIENWFKLSDSVNSLNINLGNFGNKKALQKAKKDIQSQISTIKRKYNLNELDLQKYQKISTDISEKEHQIKYIEEDLSEINHVSENSNYFNLLTISLVPDENSLPKKLQVKIIKILQEGEKSLLKAANCEVFKYKKALGKTKETFINDIIKIKTSNQDLIEKYHKNIELKKMIEKLNEYENTIKSINSCEEKKKIIQNKINEIEKIIKKEIVNKYTALEEIKGYLDKKIQDREDIVFFIEYGLNTGDVEKVEKKINLRENSSFVKSNQFDAELTRKYPEKFLKEIYTDKQKININNDKKEVCKEVLTLTENILFTASMEGDRIGGFSETTMTPGRRALFLLKLILAESDDKWPILIDQPEDNLDTRSISKEIVPFLKNKKKERQIIMVSHNANLVIESDSEQIIVTNRHGMDRPNENSKEFNYFTGGIEHTKEKDHKCKDTLNSQGIREHACDILDGGKEAFEHRMNKYNFKKD
jgi:hypothetical protein